MTNCPENARAWKGKTVIIYKSNKQMRRSCITAVNKMNPVSRDPPNNVERPASYVRRKSD